MARRRVTHTRKHGERVIALGNPAEWWSLRPVMDVVVDIDTRLHSYYITDVVGRIVAIEVLAGSLGERLHAPGNDGIDLLRLLPDC